MVSNAGNLSRDLGHLRPVQPAPGANYSRPGESAGAVTRVTVTVRPPPRGAGLHLAAVRPGHRPDDRQARGRTPRPKPTRSRAAGGTARTGPPPRTRARPGRCSRPPAWPAAVVGAGGDPHPAAGLTLCRIAFSTRFCASRSSSTGSPRGGRRQVRPGPPACAGRLAGRATMSATSARSTGVRSMTAFSTRASMSSPSISRSCRSLTTSSVSPSCRMSVGGVRAGCSATSSSVRLIASGVRSSCEALATNRRWPSKDAVQPVQHQVEGVGQLLHLVGGPVQRDPLVQAAPPAGASAIRRAVSVIRCSGLQHPPGHQPAQRDRGGPTTTSAMPPWVSRVSGCSSAASAGCVHEPLGSLGRPRGRPRRRSARAGRMPSRSPSGSRGRLCVTRT